MKPLPKRITNEIREILEGCQSGRLEHEQEIYHCGTAHCIAGWKAVLDYSKAKNNKSIIKADFDANSSFDCKITNFINQKQGVFFEDAYAQVVWKLTDKEAEILFDSEATFEQQFALLEKLENGERVK